MDMFSNVFGKSNDTTGQPTIDKNSVLNEFDAIVKKLNGKNQIILENSNKKNEFGANLLNNLKGINVSIKEIAKKITDLKNRLTELDNKRKENEKKILDRKVF